LLQEVERTFKTFDKGEGCPAGDLNALLSAIGAEPLGDAAQAQAQRRLDAAATGHFGVDEFLAWFREPAAEAAPPAVAAAAALGLKEDGEAEGTGKYDAEMEAERRVREEAERDPAELHRRASERNQRPPAAHAPPPRSASASNV